MCIKSTIIWDMMPCSPLKVNRRLRGTYCHYLQGRLTFDGLHSIISQKIVLFVTTAVRTSTPTLYVFLN
jgi:hypothetical protein